MDRNQKEALIIALAEKGKTYREIAKEAGVSPNTIKAVLNRAGLDQTTSIFARVFELYSQDKTPLEVAIALGLKSEEVLRYHHEYYALLGCNEFTKVYLWVKDNLGHTRVITTSNFTKDIGYKEGRELSKVLNYSDGESGINYNSDTLWLLIRHNLGRKLLLFLEQNLSKLVCPTSRSKFTFDIINNSSAILEY